MLGIARGHFRASNCAPRILGVADWARRRGQRYGTALMDLETNDAVDLLPDSGSGTPRTGWRYIQVSRSSRGIVPALARGARKGAPGARQVADRWHMLRNCSEMLLDAVEKRYRLVREIGWAVAAVAIADCWKGRTCLGKKGHRRRQPCTSGKILLSEWRCSASASTCAGKAGACSQSSAKPRPTERRSTSGSTTSSQVPGIAPRRRRTPQTPLPPIPIDAEKTGAATQRSSIGSCAHKAIAVMCETSDAG
ncbi:MAG: transposase family protein [Bradyrhizobium sp.]|nr:transposase family protein [Bradyrhizobium sp.]